MPRDGTSNQRGYDHQHRQRRKHFEPLIASGQATCWRCHQTINPTDDWDLGHQDDRAQPSQPEHARRTDCPAGGNRGIAARRQAQAWRRTPEQHPGLTR